MSTPAEHLLQTIESQPALVGRLLTDRHPVTDAASRLRGAERIYIVGTGTSFHGAQVGEHLLRSAGITAQAVPAFEFAQYGPQPEPEDGLILISHRGVKQFSAAALDAFKERSKRWVVITGEGSPLQGPGVLTTAPQEVSSVHTASHLGTMVRLAQLAVVIAKDRAHGVPMWEAALSLLPETVAANVATRARCEEILATMALDRPSHFIGGGPAWATASEGALKLREAAHVQAEGHELENFLHGPLISVEPGQTVFLIAEPGPSLDRTTQIGRALAAIGARVVGVGSGSDQLDSVHFAVGSHRLPEVLAPLANVVPLQWIAYLAAIRRGVDADVFRKDEPAYAHALGAIQL
ncbi:MAG TPA: SIS domain-containing protein [Candidatus Dormibacteraeota bacterium]